MLQTFPTRDVRLSHLLLMCVALCASSCVKMASHAPAASLAPQLVKVNSSTPDPRTNINTASRAELEKLPGIGKGLAARIVAHREEFGPFRRAEHLIIVRGISERRFRALRAFITVD